MAHYNPHSTCANGMLLLKDECSLCKRIFSSSFLRRCSHCGRLYCIDCSIFTEEGNIVCLNCARRMVSPKKYGTKYSPLSRYLLRRGYFTDRAVLSLAEIEGIIGDNLPFKAVRDSDWWANSRGSAQGRAWIDVGWEIQDVDLNNRTATFTRVANVEMKTEKKRKKKTQTTFFEKKLFQTLKPKKHGPPSKTKLALAQARLRNVERERTTTQQFKGKFKPKPAYEKRLFKPEAKPSKA